MSDEALAAVRTAGLRAFEAGGFRKARACFSRALLRAPQDRQVRFHLGASQYHLGNVPEARRHLEPLFEAGTIAGVRPAAVAEYLCRCSLGDAVPRAIDYAQAAIARDAQDPCAHLVLGHALMRLNRPAEALAAYDEAWRLEGGTNGRPCVSFDPSQVPFARALALTELKRTGPALEALDAALQRHPDRAATFNQRGIVLLHAQRPAEAALAFGLAVQRGPRPKAFAGSVYYNLACAFMGAGQRPQARQAVESAIAVSRQPQYLRLRDELSDVVSCVPTEAAVPDLSESSAPARPVTFADVGGMQQQKAEVRRIVETVHTNREIVRRYGIVRNGILLYGPPGSGKTFFARAIAGEFGLSFLRVSLADLVTKYVGGAPEAVDRVFADARSRTPCLLFFDEFDAVAEARSSSSAVAEQQRVNALLQQLDLNRDVAGLVIAAATNRFDALDPAAIRDGRFDYKVQVPKPDFDARSAILQTLLAGRPSAARLDASLLAHDTEGCSAAQLQAIVDDAALMAMEGREAITMDHLQRARRRFLDTHRYRGARMSWTDLVLPPSVMERLQFIEHAIENGALARQLGVRPPSGVLLSGPPGTGKTSIARVLASEIDASFFAVTPADVYSKWLGDSEQQVRAVFERARNHAPAIVFFDEVDTLLGQRSEVAAGADRARDAVLNAFLGEMDGLDTQSRILVVGATNRPDLVDAAARRPGRLGEHIELGLPDASQRLAMLQLFTREMVLEPGLDVGHFVELTEGATGADLRGLCAVAGRHAFIREVRERDNDVRVQRGDFERALAEWQPAGATCGASTIGFRPSQPLAS